MRSRRLNKRALIERHVPGRSFVDIGGLWGTRGEMVTTALGAGASRAVMADIQELGNTWWQKFETYCEELGVTGYEEQQVDICSPDGPERLGRFDFVHCSGIMYHVPDLFGFVGNLHAVTREYLLLSSVVMPDEIANGSGTIEFGPDNAYLTPALSEERRAIVAEFLTERGIKASGITQDAVFVADGRPRFGPWWWLFSGAFMSRFVRLYGMRVLAEGPCGKGLAYAVLAKRTT